MLDAGVFLGETRVPAVGPVRCSHIFAGECYPPLQGPIRSTRDTRGLYSFDRQGMAGVRRFFLTHGGGQYHEIRSSSLYLPKRAYEGAAMLNPREILWVSAMREFFVLRTAFLRLGTRAGDNTLANEYPAEDRFDATFQTFIRICWQAIQLRQSWKATINHLSKFHCMALYQVAGILGHQ